MRTLSSNCRPGSDRLIRPGTRWCPEITISLACSNVTKTGQPIRKAVQETKMEKWRQPNQAQVTHMALWIRPRISQASSLHIGSMSKTMLELVAASSMEATAWSPWNASTNQWKAKVSIRCWIGKKMPRSLSNRSVWIRTSNSTAVCKKVPSLSCRNLCLTRDSALRAACSRESSQPSSKLRHSFLRKSPRSTRWRCCGSLTPETRTQASIRSSLRHRTRALPTVSNTWWTRWPIGTAKGQHSGSAITARFTVSIVALSCRSTSLV